MERYRRRKAGSAIRRRKETQAVEARARSAGEATRSKISSRRSLVRAGGGRSGSMASGRAGEAEANSLTPDWAPLRRRQMEEVN